MILIFNKNKKPLTFFLARKSQCRKIVNRDLYTLQEQKVGNFLSRMFEQGIVYLNRNENSAIFFSDVCNAKKIKELFHPT